MTNSNRLAELRHSYFIAKGSAFLAIAFGFPGSVFFAMKPASLMLAAMFSLPLFMIFFSKSATNYFSRCLEIQEAFVE